MVECRRTTKVPLNIASLAQEPTRNSASNMRSVFVALRCLLGSRRAVLAVLMTILDLPPHTLIFEQPARLCLL